MCTTTIEMVSYRLKAGVSMADLRATHLGVNAFCLAQPGFLYRSLCQDEHQTWFDIVYWKTMEDAKAAGEAFMQDSAGQSLVNMIDNNTMQMRHMLADAQAYSAMLGIYAGTRCDTPHTTRMTSE